MSEQVLSTRIGENNMVLLVVDSCGMEDIQNVSHLKKRLN